MTQEIGTQYEKYDDQTDKTEFLKKARLHQSKFRAETLNLPYDKFGNYLTKEDGEKGYNFYNGFGIYDAVQLYRGYNKPLYSNMLRSEHIPFNLFIPFRQDLNYCKNIFNNFLNNTIQTIDRIEIEFAPPQKENYLNDGTSFDTYIEYTHADGQKGIIGIEVKYTEKEYKLVRDSKQERDINNKSSKYFTVTTNSGIYKPGTTDTLITDKFRQVWRNHILGESILQHDKRFKYFTSLTIFPSGNKHFTETSEEYIKLLATNNNHFISVTYEDFFSVAKANCEKEDYKEWLNYLIERYIVK